MEFIRVLVVSDTHGNKRDLDAVLALHEDAACVFHLGDGARDMETVHEWHPRIPVFQVAGNCDGLSCDHERQIETVISGRRFFATHGHFYGVKSDLTRLSLAAAERGADIVLFGHTHQPLCCHEDGRLFLNPGSLGSLSSYALIDITKDGILPHIETLR